MTDDMATLKAWAIPHAEAGMVQARLVLLALAENERLTSALTHIRRLIEDGGKWNRTNAATLHLIVSEALK